MPNSDKVSLADFLNSHRDPIMLQFHGRCVRCNTGAITVHEIFYRSEGLKSKEDDVRVPLCGDCHDWAHERDKKNRQSELFRLRNEALKRYEDG